MISIIIPTLNEEKIIESQLEHVTSKLTLPHEIIVFDGKSSDRTVAIAKKHADRVLEYTGGNRQTIAHARNAGAKVARGDILLFLDADCTIPNPNELLRAALNRFQHDAKLVALTCWIRVLPEVETERDRFISICVSGFYCIMNNIFHIGQASGEFQMVRKDAFEKVGGHREYLVTGEDVDLFFRLSKIGRTFFDPELTIYHTGRRAHAIGWTRLLSQWGWNTLWFLLTGKPRSRVWKVIR